MAKKYTVEQMTDAAVYGILGILSNGELPFDIPKDLSERLEAANINQSDFAAGVVVGLKLAGIHQ